MQSTFRKSISRISQIYNGANLILRILAGLIAGGLLGVLFPSARWLAIFGTLFVSALKAIAPILVFVLVIASLANGRSGFDRRFGFVIFEYLFSTFVAALIAVLFSYLFPVTIRLTGAAADTAAAPADIGEVLRNLLVGMFTNPVAAIGSGNYISILFWAVVFGVLMRRLASDGTKAVFTDLSDVLSQTVAWIINLAPFGIMGLMFQNVSENGLSIFTDYGKLVLRCIRESGITAFFTRSSAANIPVNMRLCKRLGLDPDVYSVSIPLGATINMDGAAVVITIMTFAAARTLGISVDLPSAVVLSLLSTLAACGTSGVAGGSLLLIPMACSLFGIGADVAMQVVGVGFIISVIQDSMETALNSSGDVVFTATAEYREWQKTGKSLPTFLGGETKVDI